MRLKIEIDSPNIESPPTPSIIHRGTEDALDFLSMPLRILRERVANRELYGEVIF
jgi:hypothetical protein